MNSHDTRSPDQIEADIEHTRHELDDTLDALQHKFQPRHWMDEAMHYFQGGPGEFGGNLSHQVKQNPLPVLLIGAGIAWLATSSSRPAQRSNYPVPAGPVYRSRESLDYGHSPLVRPYHDVPHDERSNLRAKADAAKHKVSDAAHGVSHGASDAAARARAGAEGAAASARHGAHRTGDRVRETGENLHHGAADMAAGARERMHEWGDEASYQAHAMASEARFYADRARAEARYRARQTRGGFLHMLDEQPLVLGALGVALGAALGAALPASRREDELMGEYRDDMLRQARHYGEEQLHRAEQVAQAAGEAALDTAHREGMSPDRGREAVDKAREKVENVAGSAREAAKSEANAQGFKTPSHQTSGSSGPGTGGGSYTTGTNTTGGVSTASATAGTGGTGVKTPGLDGSRTGADGTPATPHGSDRSYGA